jgi:4-hydroxy-tetrahydrodipicolinate synthase
VQLFELACEKKDLTAARQLSDRLLPLLSMMENEGKYTQFVKAGCELVGRPVGPPRRPLLPPSSEEITRLRKKLDDLRITTASALDT